MLRCPTRKHLGNFHIIHTSSLIFIDMFLPHEFPRSGEATPVETSLSSPYNSDDPLVERSEDKERNI
jgi:hypothetical protein